MRVLYDLNVLLDVLQHREAFYSSSAAVLSKVLDGEHDGVIPGHAVTTVHYLLTRYADKQKVGQSIDFLLDNFTVANAGTDEFRQARRFSMRDFEDAVVVAVAVKEGCDVIVTRNVSDFKNSPVRALLPEEFPDQHEFS